MKRRTFNLLTLSWVCAVAISLGAVERHARTSGLASPLELAWPAETTLQPAFDKPIALLFAHPKCPCTQATIQEFQRIEARHPGAFETFVVFAIPERNDQDWKSSRLVEQARDLRSATIVFDPGGLEASRFQAAVSGQILLFSKDLHLLYSGGVTPARGHEGDNAGQEAFEYALAHPEGAAVSFPVFGCGLITRAQSAPPQPDRGSA